LLCNLQVSLPTAPSLRFNISLADIVDFFWGMLGFCLGWIVGFRFVNWTI